MVKNVLPVVLFFVCSFIATAQSCGIEISVEKNRSFKSVPSNGNPTYYILNVKNTTSSDKDVEILVSEVDTPCDNGINKTATKNTPLEYAVVDSENRNISGNILKVQGGQTKKVKIKVSATAQTSINMWGCLKVNTQLDDCKSKSHVILSSFIPDPKAN